MTPKFGTSGLRGLVRDLTPDLIADYTRAFLAITETVSGPTLGPTLGPISGGGGPLYLGRDLRESSPALALVVSRTAREAGVDVVDCGAVPTPALALAAQGHRAIMVTGSHIPADRNGLKFYTAAGEITKSEELAIIEALGQMPNQTPNQTAHPQKAGTETHIDAATPYGARYLQAFGPALEGARIGLWAHSSVGRDLLAQTLGALGARVTELGRSEHFIPVDTEAVDEATRHQLGLWAASQGPDAAPFDALVSLDGDADRPLMTDQRGRLIPGDILGQITAASLGADLVVTPISSNSGADDLFDTRRTRIGSPYVIAGMAAETGAVVGYEANGGFLLGFAAQNGRLSALMTRDAFLPIIATLAAARTGGGFDLAARVAQEPARFTASDRIEHIPSARAQAFLGALVSDELARVALLEALSLPSGHMIDTTDGLRMTVSGGRVLHLRPSGNAPEFRLYTEAASPEAAQALLTRARALIAAELAG
ncbi:phosphomannomutase [Rhodobacter sp. KR11]|uniref:phosphomannomutase n=1 Tax=Rhodobacter sp. KR11 TaxID=2974588 RepID=UPI002222E9C3|nr:phosphomannomutase [Rhodobacter sp. KR11]MCW1920802.1 phosphomannomutase [Rhodobacter sp. KR11]